MPAAGAFGLDRRQRARGALQRGQQLHHLVARHAHHRGLQRQPQVGLAAIHGRHQHADADQPGQEFLVIQRVAVALHALQFRFQLRVVGQRVLRVAFQLNVGQQPLALRRRQLRQEQLARG
ncbi:hypothetical protein D3C72_1383940 [compost metagenome]